MSVRVASTSRYIRISCNKLTSTSVFVWLNQQLYMLHLPQSRRYVLCSYPPNRLASKIAPDHHACIFHLYLTCRHVFIRRILSACMYVTVSSYQHPCILHLHLTISHVCLFLMSLTGAFNQQSYHSANLCLQVFMSDTHARDRHCIFVIAISNHLCCLLYLQQTRKVVMVVTIAPGKRAQQTVNMVRMQILYSGVVFICVDTLYSRSFFFINLIYPSS